MLRSPASNPSARGLHAMADDAGRQRVVLFGGNDFSGILGGPSAYLGDTWEWDGGNWQVQNPATRPAGRATHAMAYDSARQRVCLFGGRIQLPATSPVVAETWIHGNLLPAASQPLGTGCSGTSGPPALASNLPFLGNPAFALSLTAVLPSAPCLFALATGTQAMPLGGGCTLYLHGVIAPFFTAADPNGAASLGLSIPLDPVLRGTALYAQAAVLDPLGAFAGLAVSAGRRLVLGD